jgi:hypothetical protein
MGDDRRREPARFRRDVEAGVVPAMTMLDVALGDTGEARWDYGRPPAGASRQPRRPGWQGSNEHERGPPSRRHLRARAQADAATRDRRRDHIIPELVTLWRVMVVTNELVVHGRAVVVTERAAAKGAWQLPARGRSKPRWPRGGSASVPCRQSGRLAVAAPTITSRKRGLPPRLAGVRPGQLRDSFTHTGPTTFAVVARPMGERWRRPSDIAPDHVGNERRRVRARQPGGGT